MAACLDDPRAPHRVVHRPAEIIRFRLLMIAAGYADGNDADTLRHDPMFKLALDRRPGDPAFVRNRQSHGWKICPTRGRCCASAGL